MTAVWRPAVVALVALVAVAVHGVPQDVAASRLSAIKEVASRDTLVALADSNFGKFVLGKHRPYHLFVLFNAKHPRHQCEPCAPFEAELELLAATHAGLPEDAATDADGTPIFFARAEYEANQQTFRTYELKSVPLLAYYSPTGNTAHPKTKLPVSYKGADLDAEGIAGFVKDHTGVEMEVYRSPAPKLIVLACLLGGVFLVVRYASHLVLGLIDRVRGSRTFWMVACIGVYFVSISGVMYDIIRGVPSFGFNPNTRAAEFIHPQSGTQYGLEGFLVGALNILCAVCAVLLVKRARTRKDSSDRLFVALSCVTAFVFLYTRILALYRFKNPWYRF